MKDFELPKPIAFEPYDSYLRRVIDAVQEHMDTLTEWVRKECRGRG